MRLPDALGQKFQMGGQAHGVQAVLLQIDPVGFPHNVQGALDKLQGKVGGVAVYRDGDQVQGDVARLVLGEGDAAAVLYDLQRTPAQVVLLLIEKLGFIQQKVRQLDALFLPFDGKADVVDEGDGGLIAHGKACILCHCQDLFRGAHDAGFHILKHLEEFGLHLVLHIVDLFNVALLHRIPRPLLKADALPQDNGLPPVRHDRRNRIVIEYLDCLHSSTSVEFGSPDRPQALGDSPKGNYSVACVIAKKPRALVW